MSSGRVSGGWLGLAAIVALAVVGGCTLGWPAGGALATFGLVLILRPFDFPIAILPAAAAGVFVAYGEPGVQRDLAVVLALTGYALLSLLAAGLRGQWAPPGGSFALAMGALAVTTGIGTVHGLLVHNSVRYVALEVFPLATLYFALAIGGLRLSPQRLELAEWFLVLVAIGMATLGFRYFATTGMRTQGLPFSPVPGFVAVAVFALALFDRSERPKFLPIFVMCVLLVHQIVTFTRGYWLALLVALPFVALLYGGWDGGAWRRWGKVLRAAGLVALILAPATMIGSSLAGWGEVIRLIGDRFSSSFETRNTPETVSNIVRLVELRTTLDHIREAPWLGRGHGSTLIVRQFFYPDAGPQWWVHQTYVMIWFKQGIIGLLALLAVLGTAIRLGLRGRRSADPVVAGWSAVCAGCTVFSAVLGLTNYYFFMTTLTFLLAIVWGIALALSNPPRWRVAWEAGHGAPPGAALGGAEAPR